MTTSNYFQDLSHMRSLEPKERVEVLTKAIQENREVQNEIFTRLQAIDSRLNMAKKDNLLWITIILSDFVFLAFLIYFYLSR